MDSQTKAQEKSEACSNVLPFWKYCLLVVATGGLYEFYWFFRVWTFIKAQNKAPGLWARIGSTVGSAIPVVNLFFIWRLLKSIGEISAENKLPARFSVPHLFVLYQLLLLGRFILDIVQRGLGAQTGPPAVYNFALQILMLFAPALALYFVQKSINDYWQLKQDLPTRNALSKVQWVITVIGVLFWALLGSGLYQMWSGFITADGRQVVKETSVDERTK